MLHTASREDQAREIVRRAGYAHGGAISEAEDERKDKKMVRSAVHQHEAHDHKGEKPTKLALKAGGSVHGKEASGRPDRRARGGMMPEGGPSKHKAGRKAVVNIKIGGGGGNGQAAMAAQEGMRVGAALGARRADRKSVV